ncbi:MAG: hypothetical protein Q7K55_05470 [Candidatus Levybacteria bacterium]|nr:hypothetical protein [Candidatus Levybacteria bacterium]
MKEDSKPKGIVLIKPIEQEFSGDGTITRCGVQVVTDSPEAAPEMAKEAMRVVAEETGMDIVGDPIEIKPRESSRSTFGFSNWEGSEWQPQ